MAQTSAALELHSVAELEQILRSKDHAAYHLHVLLMYAPWHAPSQQMIQICQTAASTSKLTQYLWINVDDSDISEKFEINAVPTFMFFDGRTGELINPPLEGANPAELRQRVQQLEKLLSVQQLTQPLNSASSSQYTATTMPSQQSQSDAALMSPEQLDERLRQLVNAAPVMIFIKGTPSAPRCGFTRQLLEIFKAHGIEKYGYFDILSDQNVREGLKRLFKWPTYPQVFVKGSFIGGLDVIKELVSENELMSQIPESALKTDKPLTERIKTLINQKKVMLFCKGSKDNPKCGFSRRAIMLLDTHHVDYDTFDILEDEDIREGLKIYSNWPTYPQLYVNGQLVGGIDVMVELDADGELASALV